jgi:hypothetical protein
MFATLIALPRQRRSWYWAAVVRLDRPYVLCRDDGLAYPSEQRPIELRGEGLWMHAICETPWRHWTVAMEAFAIEFDDPTEVWRSERGDRLGLAFDLEWESNETDVEWRRSASYDVACSVSGDLQVGDERFFVDAHGWRSHSWGPLDVLLDVQSETSPDTTTWHAPLLAITERGEQRLVRRLVESNERLPPRWVLYTAATPPS